MSVACKHCGKTAASCVYAGARDGLGRTWDEWHCLLCDTAWEENNRLEPHKLETVDALARLRSKGWSVAVHNDYRQMREGLSHSMTFWLFTHPSGVWAMGESSTDSEAIHLATIQAEQRLQWIKEKS